MSALVESVCLMGAMSMFVYNLPTLSSFILGSMMTFVLVYYFGDMLKKSKKLNFSNIPFLRVGPPVCPFKEPIHTFKGLYKSCICGNINCPNQLNVTDKLKPVSITCNKLCNCENNKCPDLPTSSNANMFKDILNKPCNCENNKCTNSPNMLDNLNNLCNILKNALNTPDTEKFISEIKSDFVKDLINAVKMGDTNKIINCVIKEVGKLSSDNKNCEQNNNSTENKNCQQNNPLQPDVSEIIKQGLSSLQNNNNSLPFNMNNILGCVMSSLPTVLNNMNNINVPKPNPDSSPVPDKAD